MKRKKTERKLLTLSASFFPYLGSIGGLQASSTAVGDMITEETQSKGQKQAQAASESLNRMSSGMYSFFLS